MLTTQPMVARLKARRPQGTPPDAFDVDAFVVVNSPGTLAVGVDVIGPPEVMVPSLDGEPVV